VGKALTLNRALLGLAALSLALGLWQLGGAAAIHGKAWLAQRLLDRAWSETLAGASGRTLAFGPAVVDGTEGLGHRILGAVVMHG